MTASRFLRAGALALAGLACARPQAGTDTGDSQAPAASAVAHLPREVPIAPTAPPGPVAETRAGAWDDLAAALATLETSEPPAIASQPWASDASDEATDGSQAAAPLVEEPEWPRGEERLKAIGSAYRGQLRGLEGRVRFAERAVQAAEVALSMARETPKTLGGPIVTNAPCIADEPVVILPPPDIEAIVAGAEERLARARDELKRARDAEDDLLTRIRRERIPLSDVL